MSSSALSIRTDKHHISAATVCLNKTTLVNSSHAEGKKIYNGVEYRIVSIKRMPVFVIKDQLFPWRKLSWKKNQLFLEEGTWEHSVKTLCSH